MPLSNALNTAVPSGNRKGSGLRHRYRVYGIVVESAFALDSLEEVASRQSEAAIEISFGSADYFRSIAEELVSDPQEWLQHAMLADDRLYMRWDDIFEVAISADGRQVMCRKLSDIDDRSFEAHLINFALSAALLQQGEEPLHATVATLDGHAVGLLGPSGAGKSTLAAFLVERGGELVTDDLLRTTFAEGAVLAYHGPLRLKLFEEPAKRYLSGAASRGRFNPLSGKMMFQPPHAAGERIHPLRLSALFHLGASPEGDAQGEVSIKRMMGGDLVKVLLAATMNTRLDTPRRLARQFHFTERLARLLPVHELIYPRNYRAMHRIAEKILHVIEE